MREKTKTVPHYRWLMTHRERQRLLTILRLAATGALLSPDDAAWVQRFYEKVTTR